MEALQALLERRAFIISIEWDPNDLMKQSVRTALLIAAAMLMIFGASGYALIVVPDLHGDLVEIGVRPSVLGGTVLHLYFAATAMFGFALMVSAAAVQAKSDSRSATEDLVRPFLSACCSRTRE